ncbi:MAG: hypothetical protein V3575_03610, partial [Candidatus Absconditabacteria bacterium]
MEKNENSKIPSKNGLQIGSSRLDLDELKFQIKTTFNSPNPWSLYLNVKKFKEQISLFINELTSEIVKLFDINESRTSIVKLYIKAEYHKVLSAGIQEYIYESKYFDLYLYFYTVCLLDKEKQCFAKALLKLYLGKSDSDINDMLLKYKYNDKIKVQHVKEFFNKLGLKDIEISSEYLIENEINKFLEKIYLGLSMEGRSILFSYFRIGK